MNAQAVRQLINDDPRPNRAYSQVVRQAVGRYARRRRAEGARWSNIEAELGISSTSARKFMLALEPAGFHQVVVVGDTPVHQPTSHQLAITTPSGFTLTGCSLDEAITAMRRLR